MLEDEGAERDMESLKSLLEQLGLPQKTKQKKTSRIIINIDGTGKGNKVTRAKFVLHKHPPGVSQWGCSEEGSGEDKEDSQEDNEHFAKMCKDDAASFFEVVRDSGGREGFQKIKN